MYDTFIHYEAWQIQAVVFNITIDMCRSYININRQYSMYDHLKQMFACILIGLY